VFDPVSDSSIPKPYPDVPQQPDFPEIERRILEVWRSDGIFERSVEGRPAGKDGENEFVFYDAAGEQVHVLNATARRVYLLGPDEVERGEVLCRDLDGRDQPSDR